MPTVHKPPLFRGTPVIVGFGPGIHDPEALHAAIVRIIAGADDNRHGLDDLCAVLGTTVDRYGYSCHVTGFSVRAL